MNATPTWAQQLAPTQTPTWAQQAPTWAQQAPTQTAGRLQQKRKRKDKKKNWKRTGEKMETAGPGFGVRHATDEVVTADLFRSLVHLEHRHHVAVVARLRVPFSV